MQSTWIYSYPIVTRRDTGLPQANLQGVLDNKVRRKITFPWRAYYAHYVEQPPRIVECSLGALKCCISGGVTLSIVLLPRVIQQADYALTKDRGMATPTLASVQIKGSCGDAAVGASPQIRILRDPPRVLSKGVRSDALDLGACVMPADWRNEAAGAGSTADGYLFIFDRIKDMLFRSGFGLHPRVIEDSSRPISPSRRRR